MNIRCMEWLVERLFAELFSFSCELFKYSPHKASVKDVGMPWPKTQLAVVRIMELMPRTSA